MVEAFHIVEDQQTSVDAVAVAVAEEGLDQLACNLFEV